MPYKISWQDLASVEIAFSGPISDATILEAVRILQGDYRFDTLRSVLLDLAGVDGCTYSAATLEDIHADGIGASFTNPNIRFAIVNTRQDVSEMTRDFLGRQPRVYPMEVFSTRSAARAWLARPH